MVGQRERGTSPESLRSGGSRGGAFTEHLAARPPRATSNLRRHTMQATDPSEVGSGASGSVVVSSCVSRAARPSVVVRNHSPLSRETWAAHQMNRSSVLASVVGVKPALSEIWVSAWGGRGPVSTTVTTDRTFQQPTPDLSNRTLRIVAHLTTGGIKVRVRFSQRFSSSPLVVGAAHVALRRSGSQGPLAKNCVDVRSRRKRQGPVRR
jgi:hypothetical protein